MNIFECNFSRCNRCGKCLVNNTIKMNERGEVRFVKTRWHDDEWVHKAMVAASQCDRYAFDAVNTETGEKTPCNPW